MAVALSVIPFMAYRKLAKTTFSAIETLLFTYCVTRYELYFKLRMTIERFSNEHRKEIAFALVLQFFVLRLASKSRAILSNNEKLCDTTKINRDLHARIFPRFTVVACNCFVCWLAHYTVSVCCGSLKCICFGFSFTTLN